MLLLAHDECTLTFSGTAELAGESTKRTEDPGISLVVVQSTDLEAGSAPESGNRNSKNV